MSAHLSLSDQAVLSCSFSFPSFILNFLLWPLIMHFYYFVWFFLLLHIVSLHPFSPPLCSFPIFYLSFSFPVLFLSSSHLTHSFFFTPLLCSFNSLNNLNPAALFPPSLSFLLLMLIYQFILSGFGYWGLSLSLSLPLLPSFLTSFPHILSAMSISLHSLPPFFQASNKCWLHVASFLFTSTPTVGSSLFPIAPSSDLYPLFLEYLPPLHE